MKIKENTPYLSMMYCNLINFFPIEYIVHVFGKNNNIVEQMVKKQGYLSYEAKNN